MGQYSQEGLPYLASQVLKRTWNGLHGKYRSNSDYMMNNFFCWWQNTASNITSLQLISTNRILSVLVLESKFGREIAPSPLTISELSGKYVTPPCKFVEIK